MRTPRGILPYVIVAALWVAFVAILLATLSGCAAIPRTQGISDTTSHLIASDTVASEPDVNHDAVIAAIANRYFEQVEVDTSLTSRQIASRLDPFSEYVTHKQYSGSMMSYGDRAFRYGLGYDSACGHIIINTVCEGSAAEDAGVLPGDEIIAMSNTLINSRYDLVRTLFIPDELRLQLYRASNRKKITLDMKRDYMPVSSVPISCKLDPVTGYVEITGFHHGTAAKLEQAVAKLVHRGATSLVIDLRGNPGGLVSEVMQAANLFVQHDGPVITKMSVRCGGGRLRVVYEGCELSATIARCAGG